MQFFGSLPHGKSADGKSVEGKWGHSVDAFGPECLVESALNDAEEAGARDSVSGNF
jgi:hypothetical protein